MTNKQQRGQFFTVNEQVLTDIVSLLGENPGRTLEPSAGAGHIMHAFQKKFKAPGINDNKRNQGSHNTENNIVGWELDDSIDPCSDDLSIVYGDFFTQADRILPPDEATLLDDVFSSQVAEAGSSSKSKFDSIAGNPPFVAWKNTEADTHASASFVKQRYSDKTNLYHLFMDRCIDLLVDGGQMVFIVPKEWMYSTSALPLREKMLQTGTITHIIDGGEEKVFPDADVPALVIFRFVKTVTDSHTVQFRSGFVKNVSSWSQRYINITKTGLWRVSEAENSDTPVVGDYFDVKVGIVSGADGIFNVTKHPDLSTFTSEGSAIPYVTTKGIEWFIDVNDVKTFNQIPTHAQAYLSIHREKLINRKITKFTEHNWWKYGAIRNKALMLSDRERFYTFGKTRSETPFFQNNDAELFSGGLIGLFLKPEASEKISIQDAMDHLNSTEFRKVCEEFGITTSNKVSFQPATLAELPFQVEITA